jgi:hypothetical protein
VASACARVVRCHEAEQRVADRAGCIAPTISPLRPYGPLRRLGVLSARLGPPIGPMAAPRDPIDVGGPMCPMGSNGLGGGGALRWPAFAEARGQTGSSIPKGLQGLWESH